MKKILVQQNPHWEGTWYKPLVTRQAMAKRQIKQKKKYYVVDNGFVHVAAFQFSKNQGKLFENLVYTELKKANKCEIFYFNDIKECDFIVKDSTGLTAIQVCYELNDENYQREINGLHNALQKLPCQQGVLITARASRNTEDKITITSFADYFSTRNLA